MKINLKKGNLMKIYYHKLTLSFTTTFLLLLCLVNLTCAATFIVEDGLLMGADDIIIGDTSYDVTFIDGTAEDIYFHEEAWNFTFTSADGATAASQALVDQVFGGLHEGSIYDTSPQMITGIIDDEKAHIYTPYSYESEGTTVYLKKAINYAVGTDSVSSGIIDAQTSTAHPTQYSPYRVYAQWEVSAVPIPSTLFLLGSGLLYITGLRRKRINQ